MIPPIPHIHLNNSTYAFSTFSILPTNNSKYVWQEETHRIRSLVEAGKLNLEAEMPEQNPPNVMELIIIIVLIASTAVGKY